MKILIFAYDLVVAGVTVNAIELAAALRDFHGHDVVLLAAPGPLKWMVEERGLRHIEAPPAYLTVHPSAARMYALREAIRHEKPDLIHAWDWAQCVDAFFVEHLLMGVPLVVTDMCMILQRLLPKSIPTTFGTPQLLDYARSKGHRRAEYLLPPVDVHDNAPGVVDPGPFRAQVGLRWDETLIVTVSRLDTDMKAESLIRTIDAVRILGSECPMKFVIVGDGDARAKLERLAQEANAALGRSAVVLTGAMIDPRAAYAAADIVVGMGGSALRGMAFGKPVLVVGEQGFWAPFTPETSESFLYRGIYGLGDGNPSNAGLAANIRSLVLRGDELRALGDYSRAFVEAHFSLEAVSTRLSALCEGAVANQPKRHVAMLDGLRTAAVWIRERRFMPFGFSLQRWLRLERKGSIA